MNPGWPPRPPTASAWCDAAAWDGVRFDLTDPRLPEFVRTAIAPDWTPGCVIEFGYGAKGSEWVLLDAAGEVIEVYWWP